MHNTEKRFFIIRPLNSINKIIDTQVYAFWKMFLVTVAVFVMLFLTVNSVLGQAVPVKLVQNAEGKWQLLRGGQPYYIMGAGGSGSKEKLAAAGANTFRTWGVGPELMQQLNRAHQLGLAVVVGHWY